MRRLLIDTHVFLWWLGDDPQLGPRARDLIANAENQVFVSAATAWEISIRKSIGEIDAPDDLDAIAEQEGFDKLPISFFHGERAGDLSQHDYDPFDRMLVAQSQAEGLDFITADSAISQYAVKTISALV
jgi:PIN domain nuclease of toxin-antitoxin system